MRANRRYLIAGCLGLCAAACGYVGDPQPPALNIPEKIGEVSVRQAGDTLLIEFDPPALTTEALPVPLLSRAEVSIGGASPQPFALPEKGRAQVRVGVAPWVGQTVPVLVRVVTDRGKASAWSDAVDVAVVAPLAAPADLRADSHPNGAVLTWRPEAGRSGVSWAVYRRGEKDAAPVEIGVATTPEFVDASGGFGTSREYTVQARLGSAVSEIAGPVKLTPIDRFGPAAPAGLTAVAGLNSIELAWERNSEPDLGSYRVYRDGAVLADSVPAPAYGDRQIESGKLYRYEVTAIDQAGNESARSRSVEITAP